MSKVLAIFLSLIIVLSGFPQQNKVLAATQSCRTALSQILFAYELNGTDTPAASKNRLPSGISGIRITLKGPLTQGGTYRFGRDNNAYSTTDIANGGEIVLVSNDPRVLNDGNHVGDLQILNSQNKFEVVCADINYFIGNDFTKDTCIISFQPNDPPSINERITAVVSQAPIGVYKIDYSAGNSGAIVDYFIDRSEPHDEKVEITNGSNGNGSFSFKISNTARTNVSLSLLDLSGKDTKEYFCKKTFSINLTPPSNRAACWIYPPQPDFTNDISVNATNLVPGGQYRAAVINKTTNDKKELLIQSEKNGTFTFEEKPPIKLNQGDYDAEVYKFGGELVCKTVSATHIKGPTELVSAIKKCGEKDTSGKVILCTSGGGKEIPGCGIPDEKGVPDPRGPAIATAIGCIHTNPAELAKDFMRFFIGIGGGLAFLMMLFGAFQMLTSGGNPETLNAGRGRLTSAVIGLLFVIFAVLLLQIIGVDILKIPGFKK